MNPEMTAELVAPDVVVYEAAQQTDDRIPKHGGTPPRLAVEVLPPNFRWSRVTNQIADHLRSGVALVWVVNPQNRDVTVYRPGQEPYTVNADQELTGDDVLPDFRCRVADFFLLPGEKPAAT